MFRTLVATATTTTFLAAGCAGGRPWPARPVAVSTAAFATSGEIATIDVLPLDLQLWVEPGVGDDPSGLREGAEVNLMGVALETLARRNYALGATIDWNGNFPGGNALTRDDLQATVGSLAHYGATAAQHPGQLPVPFLPARLGTATGADATLYVGGWSYVASHRESTGDKIAEGIAIGLVVVAVVAIVAIILGDHHGHSGGHGGGGHSSAGGSSTSGGHSGGGSGGGGVAGAAGKVGGHSGFTASRGAEHLHGGLGTAGKVADAFGRTADRHRAVDARMGRGSGAASRWRRIPDVPRDDARR